ncbi:MAG: hypothetical protein JNL19_14485 [Burkholderiales bacterium]|nr:hypothetical protein [Burkholderiales bacterium]
MEAKDAFAWIKADLTRLLTNGVEFVHIRSLLDAVARQEANAPQVSQWADLETKTRIANADRKSASDLEMFKSVLDTGKTALTTVILVNGGASVAVLAFLANISVKTDMISRVPAIAGALVWFAVGVLSAACATGVTYVTQLAYAQFQFAADPNAVKPPWHWIRSWGGRIAVVLVSGSYVAFAIGACATYSAFR